MASNSLINGDKTLRSSGRHAKAPRRYDDELAEGAYLQSKSVSAKNASGIHDHSDTLEKAMPKFTTTESKISTPQSNKTRTYLISAGSRTNPKNNYSGSKTSIRNEIPCKERNKRKYIRKLKKPHAEAEVAGQRSKRFSTKDVLSVNKKTEHSTEVSRPRLNPIDFTVQTGVTKDFAILNRELFDIYHRLDELPPPPFTKLDAIPFIDDLSRPDHDIWSTLCRVMDIGMPPYYPGEMQRSITLAGRNNQAQIMSMRSTDEGHCSLGRNSKLRLLALDQLHPSMAVAIITELEESLDDIRSGPLVPKHPKAYLIRNRILALEENALIIAALLQTTPDTISRINKHHKEAYFNVPEKRATEKDILDAYEYLLMIELPCTLLWPYWDSEGPRNAR